MLIRHLIAFSLLITSVLTSSLTCGEVAAAERETFGVLYTVWVYPQDKTATVKIRLSDNPSWVNWLRLYIDPKRHDEFLAGGEVKIDGDEVTWTPAHDDAWLQYKVELESKRSNGRYDGYVSDDWALLRADDLVPPMRTDFRDQTQSKAKIQFNLPDGWSIATRYPKTKKHRFKVDDPERYMDRPTGWLVMGNIGTRRESIGKTKVAVSGPVEQGVRHMDILAMLRWTMPTLHNIFPTFPERLLLVSAGDPMWRGALSAPGSLYLHADRPMISGNGTSTLIHELVHVAMRANGGPKADWIVEGLAEYYSLEVLRRSGTISESRFEISHEKLAEWGKDVERLDVARSHGPITARAVGKLREIDRTIRRQSDGKHSLDDVARALADGNEKITRQRFNALVEELSQSQ